MEIGFSRDRCTRDTEGSYAAMPYMVRLSPWSLILTVDKSSHKRALLHAECAVCLLENPCSHASQDGSTLDLLYLSSEAQQPLYLILKPSSHLS